MNSTVALLLSGGMDSATCLWWLKERRAGQIHTLSIDYGQRHRLELESAAHLSKLAGARSHRLLTVDLSTPGGHPLTDAGAALPAAAQKRQRDTVVPFRNLLFVAAAAAHAARRGIHTLYIAPVRDDYPAYRDCRRPFYDSLEETLRLGAARAGEFKIHTPFIHKWKSEVIALGLELGVPYEWTHTCYEGKGPACGVCDACAERIAAFKANRAVDPLPYALEVEWTPRA